MDAALTLSALVFVVALFAVGCVWPAAIEKRLAPGSRFGVNRIMPTPMEKSPIPRFAFYCKRGVPWFRIFGFGLHVTDYRPRWMPFSARNGYCRFWQVGPYAVRVLTPER